MIITYHAFNLKLGGLFFLCDDLYIAASVLLFSMDIKLLKRNSGLMRNALAIA